MVEEVEEFGPKLQLHVLAEGDWEKTMKSEIHVVDSRSIENISARIAVGVGGRRDKATLIRYWRRPDIHYSQLSLGLFSIQNDTIKDQLDRLKADASVRKRMLQLHASDNSRVTLRDFIASLLQGVAN
jgi:hypothetical protein